jgi:hypothetical protein
VFVNVEDPRKQRLEIVRRAPLCFSPKGHPAEREENIRIAFKRGDTNDVKQRLSLQALTMREIGKGMSGRDAGENKLNPIQHATEQTEQVY